MFGTKKPEPPPEPTRIQVLKYHIPLDDEWHEVPQGRRWGSGDIPLTVGMQSGRVMVWFAVPVGQEIAEDPVKLKVVGTGHEWDSRNNHIGTVQDPRGFVWHVITGGHG